MQIFTAGFLYNEFKKCQGVILIQFPKVKFPLNLHLQYFNLINRYHPNLCESEGFTVTKVLLKNYYCQKFHVILIF